jgi:hypothetical protein
LIRTRGRRPENALCLLSLAVATFGCATTDQAIQARATHVSDQVRLQSPGEGGAGANTSSTSASDLPPIPDPRQPDRIIEGAAEPGLSSIARNRLANRVPVPPEASGTAPAAIAPRTAAGSRAEPPAGLSSIQRNRLRDTVGANETPEFTYPDIHADPAKLYHDRFGLEEEHDRFLFPSLMNLIFEDRWLLAEPDPAKAVKNQLRHRMKVDIRDPDPDTANFPNGAYTLPKGRLYLENSPVGFFASARNGSQAALYQWEFLFRYGLTDNLELRIFSNGLSVKSAQGKEPATTGFSPLAFDFKANFWEENTRYHIPAMGIEVYIQTTFGSPAFNAGTQPSMNLLFDQSLPLGIGFEYNFGITGVQNSLQEIVYQFSYQWSFQRQVFKDFDVFFHGFYNAASLPRFLQFKQSAAQTSIPNVTVMGLGAIRTVNDRLAIYGSYNFGITSSSPKTIALLGFAVAF